MLNIYIVRHGQDEDNQNGILNGHRDMPLTELGKTQAQQLAQKIKNIGILFDKAYSSPLQRAYITWKIITDALSIDAPEQLDIFIERDFGSMTGKAIQDIEILCAPNIIKSKTVTYFLNPERAETFPQVLRRAKQAGTESGTHIYFSLGGVFSHGVIFFWKKKQKQYILYKFIFLI